MSVRHVRGAEGCSLEFTCAICGHVEVREFMPNGIPTAACGYTIFVGEGEWVCDGHDEATIRDFIHVASGRTTSHTGELS